MPDKKGPIDIDLFVAVNEEGDYIVCTEESDAIETLANEQGGWHARVIAIRLKGVELPGYDPAIEINAPAAFTTHNVPEPAASAEDAADAT